MEEGDQEAGCGDGADTVSCKTTDSSENRPDPQPEGRHMIHLRQALEKTVKKCLSSVRYTAFKEHFRPLYDHNSKALRGIRDQMVQQLDSNIFDEIANMFEEENILPLMNGLDELVEYPDTAWRPTGDPSVDVRAHILPGHMKHREQLAAMLKELESRNRMLQETVRARQEKLYATREQVEQICGVWQKAEEALSTETVAALEDFVKLYS
ncbi:polyamine-modulated factor 1-like [Haliotis cracherodii]|uniref:polyamine-modulated factor 1-like n=1 Tax=Haliotis cracherodii TaxID=6455 RepID=UPI0039EB995F